MSVPYTFATATNSIPLSQLDSNFATAITLGSTNIYLGNTTTTVTGLTLTGSTFTGNVTTSNAVITGGSIDGTTVGVTTASTGAFTTLSASSTVSGTGFSTYLASPPAIGSTAANTGAFTTLSASSTTTLSGGTANGVAYLNGSKVLTTGSALVFDGTNLGIGSATLGSTLRLYAVQASGEGNPTLDGSEVGLFQRNFVATQSASIAVTSGSTSTASVYLGNKNSIGAGRLVYDSSASALAFYSSAAEQMRLTSTGLGIGTSSPSYKLDVSVGTNTIAQQWQGAGTSFTLRLKSGNGATSSSSAYRLYLDYLNGTNINSYMDFYRGLAGNDGYLVFGTFGTDRMTLDSSGNLGLGVTPAAWGNSQKAVQVGNYALISNSGFYGGSYTSNAYYDNTNWKYITTDYATNYNQISGIHKWFIAPSGTAGATVSFTQAMTLNNSGQLGIGLTSPNFKLNVNGPVAAQWITPNATEPAFVMGDTANAVAGIWFQNTFSSNNATQMIFKTRTSGGSVNEVARFDSNGALLIGATSNASNPGMVYINHNVNFSAARTTNLATSSYYYDIFTVAGSGTGSISTNGTVTYYNTSSDQRLKENIVDSDSASTLVDALQVRQFDWKADGSHQRYGFVAQELVTVAPEAVHQPADPEEMMSVDYSKLVPMLVKEIQSLRARVAQLETQKG